MATKKTTKPDRSVVLKRRMRNLVQLHHFELDDQFVVVIEVVPGKKFYCHFDDFEKVIEEFRVIVDAKKQKPTV